jgi:hypothetical protein
MPSVPTMILRRSPMKRGRKRKSDFMSGLPFGKVRGGKGIGMKKVVEGRMYTGGRIVLSPYQWHKLRWWVWDTFNDIFGEVRCHICGDVLETIWHMALDHWKSPRGNGGCYRDDRFVKPACHKCNSEKGSKRDVVTRAQNHAV